MASIFVEDASVIFSIYGANARSLKARFLSATTGGRIGTNSREHITVQALEQITLNLQEGDRLALIGHNGSGKTTLLRLLAGIYEPICGRVRLTGRVAPVFDVNGGMDSESTGYENIILRGLYLGLTKAEIRGKAEEIAEFTELGPFLQMPLRTYSAGMQSRLAFAITTCIEPEILLLDETIGSGDAAFLQKAAARLEDLVRRSGILVLASHSEHIVRQMCNSAMLLERGRILATGHVHEILDLYAERQHCPLAQAHP